MTSAQVVETSVTNNSSFQNYPHPDDHTIRTTKLFFVLLSTTESEDRGRVVWGELSMSDIFVWLNRVMQDHEARASDLNQKSIFSFFLLFSQSKLLKHNKQRPKFPFNSHLWYQGFKSQSKTSQTWPFLTSVWLWFQFSSICYGKIFWYAQNGYRLARGNF